MILIDFNDYPNSGPSLSPIESFLEAMAGHGFKPGRINPGGKLNRFDVEKRGDKAGWYVFYGDNFPAGSYGDWRSGKKVKWSHKDEESLSPYEREQFRQLCEEAERQRKEERARLADAARHRAKAIWSKANEATGQNGYLAAKRVNSHGLKETNRGLLIVPAFDIFGGLQTLQFIRANGKKLFLKYGPKRGNYFKIDGGPDVFICEGYATGATIHEATGGTVIIAFDAGNILPVAENIKSKFPNIKITICADNDQWTEYRDGKPNPGLILGKAAAEAIGGKLIYPDFKDVSSKPTDYNDLARLEGLDAVKSQIFTASQKTRFSILDWSASDRFEGPPPVRQWLVENTFPLAAVSVMAAMGDAGKGMLSLDLAVKVASGPDQQNVLYEHMAFGNQIKERGKVVIFTAEDDESEVHRRFSAIAGGWRKKACKGKLFIVPLPNAGGPIPLVVPGKHGPETSIYYHEVREQLLGLDGVKLIIFDPLASFVTADVNADPAVGAYVNGLLSNLAVETGAAILVSHHMGKGNINRDIRNAEQARAMIRGTTAIVDGARAAYVLWQAPRHKAIDACEVINQEYKPNKVFFGALVKTNGPGDREIKTLIRNEETGLLEVWNDVIKKMGPSYEDMLQLLCDDIARAAVAGRAFTKTGGSGIYQRREELDSRFHNVGRNKLEDMTQALLDSKDIFKCIQGNARSPQWLDVMGGPYYEEDLTLRGRGF